MKKVIDYYHRYEEIINYLIVGGLTTLVSLGVKYALLFTILDASNSIQLQISVMISWICAVIFAYIMNRIFVFKSKSKNYFKEISSFVGGRILTLLLEMVFMWFFVTFLKLNSNAWVITFTIICQVVITLSNYILSKLFVFKKNVDNK